MNEPDWMTRFTMEAHQLFTLLSPGRLLLLIAVLSFAVLFGRLIRLGVYVLWRLALDPTKRLASLGTLMQVGLFFLIGLWLYGTCVHAAPIATFALTIAASPLVLLLLLNPARDAICGLTILLRRSLLEGDHIILESGQRGVVRQIRLTTTMARTSSGGRLLIPNSRLLHVIVEIDRRQSGIPLLVRISVADRPDEETLARVRCLLLLSPYRAASSVVAAEYHAASKELEVTIRVPREEAKDSARREIWKKLSTALAPASSEESTSET